MGYVGLPVEVAEDRDKSLDATVNLALLLCTGDIMCSRDHLGRWG